MKDKEEKWVEAIVKWYQENKRELPWRKDKNAYHIWISEIMLQQTRIEAVKEYYARFLKEIPDIQTLSEVPEEKLLKLWEGLGYYSRARNLQKAARKMNGQMPKTYEELKQLPGIGEYTAGAIASIAYNEKVPAVDGNVLRVMTRFLGEEKDILDPKTKKWMQEFLRGKMPNDAGDFNEGLMELGERVCLPNGEPICKECPLNQQCIARKEGTTDKIPVRIVKTKKTRKDVTVFLLVCKDKIAIRKRERTGLLAGMYEFPNVEEKLDEKQIKNWLEEKRLEPISKEKLAKRKHIFSHIEWNMTCFKIEVCNENEEFLWKSQKELEENYAIPTAFLPFLKELKK